MSGAGEAVDFGGAGVDWGAFAGVGAGAGGLDFAILSGAGAGFDFDGLTETSGAASVRATAIFAGSFLAVALGGVGRTEGVGAMLFGRAEADGAGGAFGGLVATRGDVD